jgi:hypothetical protein
MNVSKFRQMAAASSFLVLGAGSAAACGELPASTADSAPGQPEGGDQSELKKLRTLNDCTAEEQKEIDLALQASVPAPGSDRPEPPAEADTPREGERFGVYTCDGQLVFHAADAPPTAESGEWAVAYDASSGGKPVGLVEV